MTVFDSLEKAINRICGEGVSVESREPVSGGDINRSYALRLSNGEKLFMKANAPRNIDFFSAEAEGLSAIRKTGSIRAPEVLAVGADAKESFLLLGYIETGHGGKGASEELGIGLARMHLSDPASFVPGGNFGFVRDNYIGASVQHNTPGDSWVSFFRESRLLPQLKMAESWFDAKDRKKIDRLLDRLDHYLTEPEHPSLLHGDLWAGNYMVDREQHPWLIDPAVYVGHAEADLAMTELFGGFDRRFYEAYRSEAGIDSGYRERKDLYNLYHMLNHLNLFGGGYLQSVRSILTKYH